MALHVNFGGIEDGLCEYVAVYSQQIVGCKLLQSQYCTCRKGRNTTVSPPYSQVQYTSHCA